MKHNILFLEDNLSGIGSIVVKLRHMGVDCILSPDLNAWKAALIKLTKSSSKLDLLVLDDNMYKEPTLEKLDRPEIGTDNGSSTGSKVAILLRSEDVPDALRAYQNTPIIIYSVHTPERIKSAIGNLDDVYIFEKLRGEALEKEMLNKCKEILQLEL